MWFIALIGVLGLIAAPIALVVALVARSRLNGLRREVNRLDAEVVDLRRRVGDRPGAAPTDRHADEVAAIPSSEPPPEAPPPAPAAPTVAPRPPRSRDLETILGGQWLTWLGVLALFCGSAFFLGVDLGRSPLAGWPQLVIGLLVAAAFNAVGRFWSVRRERILGLGLLGGGIALLYLVAYAAHGFHAVVPLWLVFPLLLVVAAVGAVLALDRDSLTIAALTLVGAFLTPALLPGVGNPTHVLLPYLVAVNLGAVLAGRRGGWAVLLLGAFLATLLLVGDWWSAYDTSDRRVAAFLGVSGSWLVFAVAPWLYRVSAGYWSVARGVVLAGNGLAYALICHGLAAPGGKGVQGAVLLLLAAVYAVLSRWLSRRQGADHATRMTHATGVALAALAMPVLLDLAWVTLGWLALAVVLLVTGLRERDAWHRACGLAVLALVIGRSLLLDLPRPAFEGYHPLFNGAFLSGVVVAAVLVWLAWSYHRRDDGLSAPERRLRSPLLVLAMVVGIWKLTGELLGYFEWRALETGVGQTARVLYWLALLWAVYGAAVDVAGARWRLRPIGVSGGLVLAGAVALTAGLNVGRGHQLDGAHALLLNLPWWQGVAVAALLVALSRYHDRHRDGVRPRKVFHGAPLLITAVLVLFLNLSNEVITYFRLTAHDGLDGLLTLTLAWTLYAAAVVVWGFVWRNKPLRLLGIALLVLTVGKVFAVDMQELDRGYRIAAFVVVGVLLLAISVLYQRERRSG